MLDIILISPTTSSLMLVSRKAQNWPHWPPNNINNAANNAKSQYWKYVDDLTLAENRKIFETGGLQKDLNEFSDWAKKNQLKLNPSKCQALEVCFKNGEIVDAEVHQENWF